MRLPLHDFRGGGVDVDFGHLTALGDNAEFIEPTAGFAAEFDAGNLAAEVRTDFGQDVRQRARFAALDGAPSAVVVLPVAVDAIIFGRIGSGGPNRRQHGRTKG